MEILKIDRDHGFFERHTFWPILSTAVFGLALTLGAVWCFKRSCGDLLKKGVKDGVCFAMQQNPPWLPLASLASAPSLLLTWYWRTAHRKRDLDHKSRELQHRERELQHKAQEVHNAGVAVERSAAEKMIGDVRRIRGSLDDAMPARVTQALVELERLAESECCWQEIVDGLASFLRKHPAQDTIEENRNRQRALRLVSRINTARLERPTNVRVALPGAVLTGLVLSGLDLQSVDLEEAILRKTNLRGAKLKGANLTRIDAERAEFDGSTQLDAGGLLALQEGRARDVAG